MASYRRIVAISTLVVFMAVWGAVVKLGPGGGATSSASTAVSTGTSSTTSGATSAQSSSEDDAVVQNSPADNQVSQAPAPLTTSQS